ncbi:hypothetical protein, partial [Streptococcus henryi]|uniref:hypothetical protein n=1 Tax=Streptococcus henryi TaxID=439219 RepID=UPI001B7FC5AD
FFKTTSIVYQTLASLSTLFLKKVLTNALPLSFDSFIILSNPKRSVKNFVRFFLLNSLNRLAFDNLLSIPKSEFHVNRFEIFFESFQFLFQLFSITAR